VAGILGQCAQRSTSTQKTTGEARCVVQRAPPVAFVRRKPRKLPHQ